MTNILHIIDTTGPGGAETVYIELADKIRNEGMHSIAIVRGEGWVQQELLKRGIETVVVETRGAFNIKLLIALRAIVKQKRIDLIQSHLLGANVYAALVGWISRTPVVGTFHGMVDLSPKERFRRIKLWLMNRGLKASVCVSSALADYVADNQLLNRKRNHIIYNGVDIPRYQRESSQQLKSDLNLGDNTILLGCLGNIRPAKNYVLMIDALALLHAQYPDLHVVIGGDPKPRLMEKLNSQINAHKLAQHVHFLGHISDSAAYLAELDIFVLCSTSEGFSIATVEAMASRLPVVATRCGGPEEIITHGQDGLLVANNQADQLAQAISELIDDAELSFNLAEKAVSTASTRFSLDNMIEKYLSLYQAYLPNKSDQ